MSRRACQWVAPDARAASSSESWTCSRAAEFDFSENAMYRAT